MKTVYFRLDGNTYRIRKHPHDPEDVDICRLRSWMWVNSDFFVHEWMTVPSSIGLFRILSMDSLGLNDPRRTEIIDPPFIHKVLFQTAEDRYYPDYYDAKSDSVGDAFPLAVRTQYEDLPDEGPISETSFTPILFRADGYYFRTPRAARDAKGPFCTVEPVPVLLRAHLPLEDPIPTTVAGVPVFYTSQSDQP